MNKVTVLLSFLSYQNHEIKVCQGQHSVIPFCYFFCPTECERFILPHKDSFNVVFFYLKADEDSMKIICVLFVPKLRFRHSYHFEKLQHFLIDSNFFKAVTHKQRIFILNDKHEQKKLIIKSMRDVDYCDSNY